MILEDFILYQRDLKLNWKSIPEFEGLYEIAENGNVWSCKYYRFLAKNRNIILSKRVEVKIVKKTFLVHRLVGLLFVPNPKKYKYLIFKDGDKTNVNYSNLEFTEKHHLETLLDKNKVRKQFLRTGGTIKNFQKKFYPGLSLSLVRKHLVGLVNTYCTKPIDTENEKWKSIEGTYSHFYISTAVRVWNALRKVIVKTTSNGKNLIFYHNRKSSKDERVDKKVFLVHILVAKAFLRGYNKKKHDVVFKDGDHLNPQLYNLDFQLKSLRGANFRPIKTK